MIKLQFSGMCEGCPNAEITVSKVGFYGINAKVEVEYTVRCEHEDACRRLTKEEDDK